MALLFLDLYVFMLPGQVPALMNTEEGVALFVWGVQFRFTSPI